jgi:hypothetical protein
MKVIISLTSIPSRFKYLPGIIQNCLKQTCHEIWINIPKSYHRFPDWDKSFPLDLSNFDSKLKINFECEDMGPGTKVFGSAQFLNPEDLIVYIDDDTNYENKLVTNLLKWFKTDEKSAWGISGFKFENYFKNTYPRQHGIPMDVLEGYGGVIVKAGWIQKMTEEFKELREEARAADDVILSNLLTKQGVTLKTVYTPEFNVGRIQQFTYGFEEDALHHQFQGGHHENYLNVLKSLEVKGKSYFKYRT